MKRPSGPRLVIRFCLMAAAVWWWSLLLNICSNVPQLDLERTIAFNCPVTGLAFITVPQRNLLYGLVPLCLALVAVDVALRRRKARP